MKQSFFKNNVYSGLFLGMIFPFLGFFLIQFVFYVLVQAGLMDATSTSIETRRLRTMTIFAICCNLVPFNFYQKRRFMNLVRGIVMMTFLCALVWILYFKDSLFIR